MNKHFLAVFAVLFLVSKSSETLKCRNEFNEDVDWYFIYKAPKLEKKESPLNSGFAYFYLSSDNHDNGWILSDRLATDQQSFFGQTLNQLYNDRTKNYILYNDQPPTGTSSQGYGHSKGVLAMDENTGFWLVHSVPHFPPPIETNEYYYPNSGRENGQTALCVSVNTATEVTKIVRQLLYIQPKIYDNFITKVLEQMVPNLVQLLNRKWIKDKSSQVSIISERSNEFISFAKSEYNPVDLYSDIVAPGLQADLMVETWRRGAGGPLPSECDLKFKVENVMEVKVNDYFWKNGEDHAKWAITEAENNHLSDNSWLSKSSTVCVGDINRMHSQFKRGGGTVCFANDLVWIAFKRSVAEVEPCPKEYQRSLPRKKKLLGENEVESESFTQSFNIYSALEDVLDFLIDLLLNFFGEFITSVISV